MQEAQVLQALSALANDTRLAIVRELVRHEDSGICAGGIAAKVGASASRLSFHMNILEQAGLIRSARDGRHVIYKLDRSQMRGVVSYMLADCCGDNAGARSCCAEPPRLRAS